MYVLCTCYILILYTYIPIYYIIYNLGGISIIAGFRLIMGFRFSCSVSLLSMYLSTFYLPNLILGRCAMIVVTYAELEESADATVAYVLNSVLCSVFVWATWLVLPVPA